MLMSVLFPPHRTRWPSRRKMPASQSIEKTQIAENTFDSLLVTSSPSWGLGLVQNDLVRGLTLSMSRTNVETG